MEKFDPTKPVQTRDGRRARIICTDRVTTLRCPIVALVCFGEPLVLENVESPGYYQADGRCLPDVDNPTDLVNIPQQHTVWLNFYAGDQTGGSHTTREDADKGATPLRIACVKVTYKEGEGL